MFASLKQFHGSLQSLFDQSTEFFVYGTLFVVKTQRQSDPAACSFTQLEYEHLAKHVDPI